MRAQVFLVLSLISSVLTDRVPGRKTYEQKGRILNELKDGEKDGWDQKCPNVAILFCKHWYSRGNVGSHGHRWFDAVADLIGYDNLAVQGVNLDHKDPLLDGIKGYERIGNKAILPQFRKTIVQCPKTKFVLGGEKSGARMMRFAIMNLTAEEAPHIAARMDFPLPASKQVCILTDLLVVVLQTRELFNKTGAKTQWAENPIEDTKIWKNKMRPDKTEPLNWLILRLREAGAIISDNAGPINLHNPRGVMLQKAEDDTSQEAEEDVAQELEEDSYQEFDQDMSQETIENNSREAGEVLYS